MLESHYRVCACRSTTPFFSERAHRTDKGHVSDASGKFYRTLYQHDRDKVLYSQSFRRMKLKTQIFPEHTDDHLRTRLLHTLEVAQIARHLARQLRLNEDLVDAIALAHDVGHAPFAHSGERALHRYLIKLNLDGFKHNWQSLRVVDKLENAYPNIPGLNLTMAVRLGILNHTKLSYKLSSPKETCSCDMAKEVHDQLRPGCASTNSLESQLVALADEFAQMVHDFEDAIVSHSLTLNEIQKEPKKYKLLNTCLRRLNSANFRWMDMNFALREVRDLFIARLRSELIFQLTLDTLEMSRPDIQHWESETFGKNEVKAVAKFNAFVRERGEFKTLIKLDKLKDEFESFKQQIVDRVVRSERVSRMDGKADYMIHRILDIYLGKPLQAHDLIFERYIREKKPKLNRDFRNWDDRQLALLGTDPIFIRSAIDYIAGMTDRFAIREYDQLFSAYPRMDL
jgi:dGTPase